MFTKTKNSLKQNVI